MNGNKLVVRCFSLLRLLLLLSSVSTLVEIADGFGQGDSTALDEYVARPDPSYTYRVLPRFIPPRIPKNWKRGKQLLGTMVNTYVLNMTSQTWLTNDDVDRSVWWHYMTVTVPGEIDREDTALLIIKGGDNNDNPPDPFTDTTTQLYGNLATTLKMVVATIDQVPNGPIQFSDGLYSNMSDLTIAHTWRLFIENTTDNADWLLQLPMTKAVVRGMDTVTSFANSKINRFYMTGASKRGWITWTTAAVDRRVVGIVPIVMDMLNLPSSMMHHYRSLGGWSFGLEPYWSENIPSWINHPNFHRMVNIIDPIHYSSRITIPKLLITAGNDQLFLPDDSHYYYDHLRGPTFLRIVPNALHTETGKESSILVPSFILMLEKGWRLPKMKWFRSENATHARIVVKTELEPRRVGGWIAYTLSETRRDFRRLMAKERGSPESVPQDILYTPFEVNVLSPTIFQAAVRIPDHGWACFFVETQYATPDKNTISTTTEVHIVPSTYSTKTCNGAECVSDLV
ncbi:Autocrine proliferation repressor protein A [Holothuria leucospilota]|uniref:Autocrine proliferation repressor protein A n=1 Tax=Holothuria leucospilota TaxID=206669 RepID=A0A9Q1C2C6_HOLLE|nr:Autocrine proliferation repressor protein A [Holothuria leucospilota]